MKWRMRRSTRRPLFMLGRWNSGRRRNSGWSPLLAALLLLLLLLPSSNNNNNSNLAVAFLTSCPPQRRGAANIHDRPAARCMIAEPSNDPHSSSLRSAHPHRRCPRLDDTRGVGGSTALCASAAGGGGDGWDSFVFEAERAANQLASWGLNQQQDNVASAAAVGGGSDMLSLLQAVPVLYAAGLLTAVSPCVWGLLPVTVAYIGTAADERRDKQTLLPTIAYAAGLAVVFCGLGVAAALFGGVFGSSGGGTSFVLSLISYGICLAMGLQLLDLVQLPLSSVSDILKPSSASGSIEAEEQPILIDASGQIMQLQEENDEKESQLALELSSLARVFVLGGSSAIVASPCATPVLTSILAYVAGEQSPFLGGALLLAYTAGYSTPLLWIAAVGSQAFLDLRRKASSTSGGWYATLAPWVTPGMAGILLWYGTTGLLTTLLGDPSMAGLAIIE